MNSSGPLISIVTPVLNDREHIGACIASVLAQDYDRTEHIVVDGGSTDGTVAVLHKYATDHPGRVRYLTGRDRGPGDGWNKGLKIATGDIFGCLGADDECEPGALRAVVEFFESHADADFVHGHCRVVDANGTMRMHMAPPFNYRRFVNTAIDIATTSAYYRRRVLEQVGWLDECGDDFDLMLRITRAYEVHRLDRVLSTLRFFRGSAFNPSDAEPRRRAFRETFRISRKYGGSLFSSIALRYYWWTVLAFIGVSVDLRMARWVSRGVARVWSR